jgi:hypothetical protein
MALRSAGNRWNAPIAVAQAQLKVANTGTNDE